MSRRKRKPTRRMTLPIEQLHAIVERTRTEPLAQADHATLQAAVDTLARLTEELETKTTTLERVRRLIFGPRSETTETVLGKDQTDATPANPEDQASATTDGDTPRKPRPGHGRNGAEDYPHASQSLTPHSSPAIPAPSRAATGSCIGSARSPRSWCASPGSHPCRCRSMR